MFIGWIRKDSLQKDIEEFGTHLALDIHLVVYTILENQSLSFAAYEENKMVALITAFEFDNSFLINGLYYLEDITDDGIEKLVTLLLRNINEQNKTILFMGNKKEQEIFQKVGFKQYARFKKAVHSSGSVAFNFSNATSKSINNENFLTIVKKLDTDTYKENREHYISHILLKQSSLMLSTDFGYQHSYGIGNSLIKISPWVMVDEAFMDAEKLIRGVLYHRGLKTIISFIPSDVKEITDLYLSYGFELKEDYKLLYLNKKPNINLESVYGF
jgi:N-acetylglutamate synthase-like GNAT family acetyltransferase